MLQDLWTKIRGMRIDDVLAIVPNFEDRVLAANDAADGLLEEAQVLDSEITKLSLKSTAKKDDANRKKSAVKRFRTIAK